MSDITNKRDPWHPNYEAAHWGRIAADYLVGKNRTYDLKKAEKFLKIAWEMGDNASGYYLAYLVNEELITGDIQEVSEIIQKLESEKLITDEDKLLFGFTTNGVRVEDGYLIGTDGVKISIEKIKEYYRGDPEAFDSKKIDPYVEGLKARCRRIRNEIDRIVTVRLKQKGIIIATNIKKTGMKIEEAEKRGVKFKIPYKDLYDACDICSEMIHDNIIHPESDVDWAQSIIKKMGSN